MRSEALPADFVYRGRFAPSPTGPLHFGSLVAAVASYAAALRSGGEWLVRIEDIDPPREVPGATDAILESLTRHGFRFTEPLRQSTRLDYYDELLAKLLKQGLAYPCSCSRSLLRNSAVKGRAGLIYPGTCRNGADQSKRPAVSVRLRCDDAAVRFSDALQGPLSCQIATEIGDFLLRRGDGLIAYQTAVAADDHAQGITEVVRGTDLLDSTFMQLALFRVLGWSPPRYAHFPVVTGSDGAKLSKQTGAPGIENNTPQINLLRAISFLKHEPPATLKTAPVGAFWEWVAEHWNPAPLAGIRSLPERSIMMQ